MNFIKAIERVEQLHDKIEDPRVLHFLCSDLNDALDAIGAELRVTPRGPGTEETREALTAALERGTMGLILCGRAARRLERFTYRHASVELGRAVEADGRGFLRRYEAKAPDYPVEHTLTLRTTPTSVTAVMRVVVDEAHEHGDAEAIGCIRLTKGE